MVGCDRDWRPETRAGSKVNEEGGGVLRAKAEGRHEGKGLDEIALQSHCGIEFGEVSVSITKIS